MSAVITILLLFAWLILLSLMHKILVQMLLFLQVSPISTFSLYPTSPIVTHVTLTNNYILSAFPAGSQASQAQLFLG